jgi:hypothetical protein
MSILKASDKTLLRALAGRYSELANLPIQKERLERYARSNDLELVRPIVLIDEVPWGEIRDDSLRCRCSPEVQWLEGLMRRALYQWEHFQVDLVIPPQFRVHKQSHYTGIGLQVQDVTIKGDTGADISSHEYHDQLKTEADLDKIRLPVITYDRAGTEATLALAREVFDGLLEVKLCGQVLGSGIWDRITRFRGVDTLLLDLAMRPEFMHQTVARFAEVAAAEMRQSEEQGLLDPEQVTLHCTPACTKDLPARDYKGGPYRAQDVWGRCAAQIFGSVSPEMHDEFDLAYHEKLFARCGLVYYGCCEPMDTKIHLLRKRFPNLRKVSITPWADPVRAAREIGRDFVLAAKPNPAFVAGAAFNPAPVEEEITRYCEAARENKTPLEFVIKDISTIANRPENLARWADTVRGVIDRYY